MNGPARGSRGGGDMARVGITELTQVARQALRRAGASRAMAETTARCLVEADAHGLATHGVTRVPTYVAHLKSGRARGDARVRILSQKPAMCLIDAGDGLAFPACERAVAESVRRGRTYGIGAAGVTNSHHSGALGVLLAPAAAAGMAGLAFSNASAAIMPWGGSKPVFGTNPVAAVFPRRDAPPLVIDLSLTQVTRGQILLYQKAGKPLPEGWGMDADGRPTTDPQKILFGGSLHAVGGMKGTMLALAVEVLTCALTGAMLSHQGESMHQGSGPPLRLGQLFVAIDPEALAGTGAYYDRIETLVAAMLADEGVRLPGARRTDAHAAAERDGIEISDELWAELTALARRSRTSRS